MRFLRNSNERRWRMRDPIEVLLEKVLKQAKEIVHLRIYANRQRKELAAIKRKRKELGPSGQKGGE
jgi:hypothetical protein